MDFVVVHSKTTRHVENRAAYFALRWMKIRAIPQLFASFQHSQCTLFATNQSIFLYQYPIRWFQ